MLLEFGKKTMKIYNTLTRTKQELKPIKRGRVNIYVCGPTVYDEPHIGHARSAYVFEVVRRCLVYRGYKVKLVKNITDVDDKIIDKARSLEGMPLNQATKEIAERFLKRYHEDMAAFGIGKPDIEPKATTHIKDMIKLIELLIKKDYAYEVDGDVYYKVRKFANYGNLSNQSLDKMEIGARISPGEKKEDPLDFALWKKAKENEPSWDSPWGNGRPGWHIECTAMSTRFLGENFDIHGGGLDLAFPHHENEIAQAQAFRNPNFANLWMHNGLLTINGEKMSKSLGNFISVKDALKKSSPEVLKFFFLASHYRSPVDFNEEKLAEAKRSYERFSILFDRLDRKKIKRAARRPHGIKSLDGAYNRFIEALDDDFNTPKATGELYELANLANRLLDAGHPDGPTRQSLEGIRFYIEEWGGLFRLFEAREEVEAGLVRYVEDQIKQRDEARRDKDFKAADRIRKGLLEKEIILEDGKDGTYWRKA